MDRPSTPAEPQLMPPALLDLCFHVARTTGLSIGDPTIPGWTPQIYSKMLAVVAGTMLGNTLADLLHLQHDGLAVEAHDAFQKAYESVLRRRGVNVEISGSASVCRSDPPAGKAVPA